MNVYVFALQNYFKILWTMRPSKAIVCDLFVKKEYTCLHLPAYTLL